MIKIQLFETPIRPSRLTRGGSNRFKPSEGPKPVRLSTYHHERASSKSKLFQEDVVNSPWKKSTGNSSRVRDLHRNIEKLITAIIGKLEEKRRSWAEQFQETELRAAEQLLSSWSHIIVKEEAKVLPSITVVPEKQNPQKVESPVEIRFRGATFSSIPGLNSNFQLEVPIINVSCASNNRSTEGQSTGEKEFDIKSTSSMQIEIPESPTRLPPTNVEKPPSNRLSNLRPPPLNLLNIK